MAAFTLSCRCNVEQADAAVAVAMHVRHEFTAVQQKDYEGAIQTQHNFELAHSFQATVTRLQYHQFCTYRDYESG
jgi:hypothetical protein